MKIRNPKYPFKQCVPWENCPTCFEDFSLTPCTNCGNGFEDEYIEVPSELEQLTTRIAELEAEVERLSAAHVKACQAKADSQAELAAEQLNNKLLREALGAVIKVHGYESGIPVEAISTQASTEALDNYVAEKVKEAGKFDMWKTNPYTKVLETSIEQLTKQRDLAVEALEKTRGALAYVKANGRDNPNLMESTAWHGLAAADKALALPRDTSALDKYVAEKVKESHKVIPREGLVPHAYQLEATHNNAEYWYKWGHSKEAAEKGESVGSTESSGPE